MGIREQIGQDRRCEIESPLANVAFEPEHYKLEAQRMVLEAGVDMYMHSYLTGCIQDGNEITHVLINNKNGTEALAARIFIDCTGDADLAHISGVPMQESEGQTTSADVILLHIVRR